MFKIIEGNSRGLTDVGKFIDVINEPTRRPRWIFDKHNDIFVTRAPGRLDVMGGIADYSGSLVLEMPIAEATLVGLQKSNDSLIKIVSLHVGSRKFSNFEMTLADLETGRNAVDYAPVKDSFARDRSNRWAAYAAGVFYVLNRELGVKFQTGARILISSHVPVGKGVSSSGIRTAAPIFAG